MADVDMVLKDLERIPELSDRFFKLIPQATVQVAEANEPEHDSSWDYAISPEGRHWFSVCAEGLTSGYLRLYEYLPQENCCIRSFALEDEIITYSRAIRPSKIHSSLSFLEPLAPGGCSRILLATHMTAAAPGHPRWMPFAYYTHLWEGFPGSNLLIYDPDSRHVEDLGIPVIHESIYGGVYEKSTDSFYFSGYHRGHVYRFDLKTRKVTDFGQATEFGTWRYIHGLDGNLYSTTASGRLFRINITKQIIEDIPFDFPFSERLINTGTNNKLMHFAHSGGKLWFTALSCEDLLSYDYASGQVLTVCDMIPEEIRSTQSNVRCMGMASDDSGVLWYLCEMMGFGSFLVRYDPAHDKKPENMGLMGTPERIVHASFGCFIQKDRIYVNDTNRMDANVAVFSASLSDIRKNAGKSIGYAIDPLSYLHIKNGAKRYAIRTGKSLGNSASSVLNLYSASKKQRETQAFALTLPPSYDHRARTRFNGDSAVNATFIAYSSCWVVKLWQDVGIEAAQVHKVGFNKNNDVMAICGSEDYMRYTLRNGKIIQAETAEDYLPPDPEILAGQYSHLELPWQPERRHLAYATAACTFDGGRTLIGTQDGMLAILSSDGEHVFSLGAVTPGGPIHDLAPSPDKKRVIGVSGDRNDLGCVFQYDDERGLILYGRIFFHDANTPGLIGSSNEPTSVAWSPDGAVLAIGVRDRLGCVYAFQLE